MKKYLEVKSKGIKNKANRILDEFTKKMSTYPTEKIREIAYEILDLSREKITEKHRDFKFEEEKPKLKIQHRLIETIILPILIEDFKKGRLGASRELSKFEFMFHNLVKFEEVLPEIPFPTDWRIGEFFLETELRNNPNDKEAANLLLNRKISQLDYDIHELPEFGLLVDIKVLKRT